MPEHTGCPSFSGYPQNALTVTAEIEVITGPESHVVILNYKAHTHTLIFAKLKLLKLNNIPLIIFSWEINSASLVTVGEIIFIRRLLRTDNFSDTVVAG